MTDVPQHRIDPKRLAEAVQEYREDGYEVIVEPRGPELPAFLQGMDIDLIARRGSDSVVVVVTTQQEMRQSSRLEQLASAVEQQEGWRLDLMVACSSPGSFVVPSAAAMLTPGELRERLAEVEQLRSLGAHVAALLLVRSAAEGTLRLLVNEQRLDASTHDPVLTLKTLLSLGLLERSDYALLEQGLHTASAVAHGYRWEEVDSEWLGRLIQAIHKLIPLSGAGRERSDDSTLAVL